MPHCGKQTGDQLCAQARHEVSVWGCLLVEHSDSSTVAKPILIQTYDPTLRTNQWLSSRFLAAVGIGLQKLGFYDLEMYSIRLFGWTKAILATDHRGPQGHARTW